MSEKSEFLYVSAVEHTDETQTKINRVRCGDRPGDPESKKISRDELLHHILTTDNVRTDSSQLPDNVTAPRETFPIVLHESKWIQTIPCCHGNRDHLEGVHVV